MKTTLCMALVTNAVFYVFQHVCHIYFTVTGPWVAYVFVEHGPDWFTPYSRGIVGIAGGLLLWTVLLPTKHGSWSRVMHTILIVTAALNLVLAVGTNGLLAMFSERDFAETATNQTLRAKHSRLHPNKARNP